MLENEAYFKDLEQCNHLSELTKQQTKLEEKKIEYKEIFEKLSSLDLKNVKDLIDYFFKGATLCFSFSLFEWMFLLILYYILKFIGIIGFSIIFDTVFIVIAIFYDWYIHLMAVRRWYVFEAICKEKNIEFDKIAERDKFTLSCEMWWQSITNDNRYDFKAYLNYVQNLLKEIEDTKVNITREIAEEYTKLDMKSEKGELKLPREYWYLASELEELYHMEGANTLQKGLTFLKMK